MPRPDSVVTQDDEGPRMSHALPFAAPDELAQNVGPGKPIEC